MSGMNRSRCLFAVHQGRDVGRRDRDKRRTQDSYLVGDLKSRRSEGGWLKLIKYPSANENNRKVVKRDKLFGIDTLFESVNQHFLFCVEIS